MDVDESTELARVMSEIAEALGAVTSVLTIHPVEGEATPIHVDPRFGIERGMVPILLQELAKREAPQRREHEWIRLRSGDAYRDVLAIPVQRTPEHNPLMISSFFAQLSSQQRQKAEEVYRRRSPFAVGYFRLWQLERTRLRRSEALEAALNRSEFGVLLLDLEGKLVFENETASKILDAANGLRRRHGGIAGTTIHGNGRLKAAIEHVTRDRDGTHDLPTEPLMRLERLDQPALIVSVMPTARHATEARDAAAILYVLDPVFDTARMLAPICKLYGLTDVETKLTCLMVAGTTLAEAATQMRIKQQSARGYLKQVFVKTGTHRQADLVRTMLSNLVRTTRGLPQEAVTTL